MFPEETRGAVGGQLCPWQPWSPSIRDETDDAPAMPPATRSSDIDDLDRAAFSAPASARLAVALIEASKTFRKLRGYKGMPKLVAALRAHDAKLTPTVVDAKEKAA